MVSEDSDQFVPGLASVHRLCNLGDLSEAFRRQMAAGRDHLDDNNELLEVLLLRGSQRM